MPDRLTDERGCCAHLTVTYRTEEAGGGAVRGYWLCTSGCGCRFVREAEVLALRKRVAELESALADKWDEECANCGNKFTTQHPDAPEEVALFRTAKVKENE